MIKLLTHHSHIVPLLKQFVRYRVVEIQEDTMGHKWCCVPSKKNPADLVSRGVKAELISASTLWCSGPPFLQNRDIIFPCHLSIQHSQLPEFSLHTTNIQLDTQKDTETNVIHKITHKFSNFDKIIRIFAYVQRLLYNCQNQQRYENSFSFDELTSSKNKIIAQGQKEMFSEEYEALL